MTERTLREKISELIKEAMVNAEVVYLLDEHAGPRIDWQHEQLMEDIGAALDVHTAERDRMASDLQVEKINHVAAREWINKLLIERDALRAQLDEAWIAGRNAAASEIDCEGCGGKCYDPANCWQSAANQIRDLAPPEYNLTSPDETAV